MTDTIHAAPKTERLRDDPRSAGALFQFIRDGLPHTRADLAVSTRLARPTVAARVDELLASGLIVPMGEAVSTGGRPPANPAEPWGRSWTCC